MADGLVVISLHVQGIQSASLNDQDQVELFVTTSIKSAFARVSCSMLLVTFQHYLLLILT